MPAVASNRPPTPRAPTSEELQALGQRAIDYYIDTGLCVFCNADDCMGIPHEECNVGEVTGIKVTKGRKARKALERNIVTGVMRGRREV